jgi:hypothetical protein
MTSEQLEQAIARVKQRAVEDFTGNIKKINAQVMGKAIDYASGQAELTLPEHDVLAAYYTEEMDRMKNGVLPGSIEDERMHDSSTRKKESL